MAHAALMTDTGDMELLERKPSLAVLAGYAAEARHGDGRLVVLGGEAGVGKTALLERFQRDLPAPARAAVRPGRPAGRRAAGAV
jgi:putative ribosome biogenesis GTPase RsgA